MVQGISATEIENIRPTIFKKLFMEEMGKGRNYKRRGLKKKNFPNRKEGKAKRYEHNQLLCGMERKIGENRFRFVVLHQLMGALKTYNGKALKRTRRM